jgi:uncharacterized protein
MSVVRSHPLVTFFVLAYALSWWGWILYAFNPDLPPIARLLRRMVRWRVGPEWYAVALLLPVVITLAATVLNVLLGAQAPSSAELGGWTGLVPGFFLLLLIPGIGGAWEEPGWRGYTACGNRAGGRSRVLGGGLRTAPRSAR